MIEGAEGVSNEHGTQMAFSDLLQEKVARLRSCLPHWDRHFVSSVSVEMESRPVGYSTS